jgi:transposase
VGVDTGKTKLNIYIRPLDIYFVVTNDDDGIKTAIAVIKKHRVTRVVIEATERLEQPFIMACAKAKIPFVVANPVRIKRFAGVIIQKAKTDKLDAKLIAYYAEIVKPELSKLKAENIRLMSDLLSRRRQLMGMQTMEKNRLQIQLKKIDNKLHKLIESCDGYKIKNDIVQSVPGVGNVVAFNLISEMPELGYITNKEASSFVDVAPFNRE